MSLSDLHDAMRVRGIVSAAVMGLFVVRLAGAASTLDVTLEECFPPPTEKGNAADDYGAVFKDPEFGSFVKDQHRDSDGFATYDLDSPFVDRILAGTGKKQCQLYPGLYPFPRLTAIHEMKHPDWTPVYDMGLLLCRRAQEAYQEEEFDRSFELVRSAYWYGRHLAEEYVSIGQTRTGRLIMDRAAQTLVELASKGHKENPKLYPLALRARMHIDELKRGNQNFRTPSTVEDPQRALAALKEGPKWYWTDVMVFSGTFARLLTLDIPDDDIELAALAETFSLGIMNRGRKSIFGYSPRQNLESYRENAPAILAEIKKIAKAPPSPFLGSIAEQVLVADREDLLTLGELIDTGKMKNGTKRAPRKRR